MADAGDTEEVGGTSLAASVVLSTAEDMTSPSCNDKVNHGCQGINAPSSNSDTTNHLSKLLCNNAAGPATFKTGTAYFNSTDTNAAAMAPSTDTTTSSSISFAESLLHAGQITQGQFDSLASHIKHDIDSIGHEHPLVLTATGKANISLAVTQRRVEAVAAVFSITELLEAILFYVHTHTLIVDVPLVCRAFRDVVQSSQMLEEQFYEPSSSSTYPSVFGAVVEGLYLHRGADNIMLTVTSKKLKPSNCYDAIRCRQLSYPVVKAAELYQVTEAIGQKIHFCYVYDTTMQCEDGITFGDILDMVDQDKHRRLRYFFILYDYVARDGLSSDNFKKWMAGGELKIDRELR